jgi:DNA-binding transcriptional LysR family regulator
MEDAESELLSASKVPRGRLRVGMPLVCGPFQPTLLGFVRAYPEIELDLDFNDRLVDVVEEGFDVVVRTGKLMDSRFTSRHLGTCRMLLVGAPDYFARHGTPQVIDDLAGHHCLRFKSTATGKLSNWPLPDTAYVPLSARLVCSHVEMLHYAVLSGAGIACLPDFLVTDNLRDGSLQSVLVDVTENSLDFHLVWPMSRHTSPKLRAFIDYMVDKLLSR